MVRNICAASKKGMTCHTFTVWIAVLFWEVELVFLNLGDNRCEIATSNRLLTTKELIEAKLKA